MIKQLSVILPLAAAFTLAASLEFGTYTVSGQVIGLGEYENPETGKTTNVLVKEAPGGEVKLYGMIRTRDELDLKKCYKFSIESNLLRRNKIANANPVPCTSL